VVVRTKPGVEFAIIAPGGFVLLAAIEYAATHAGTDLVITSATDGEHSGPNDPHHRGEAYDVRTNDLPEGLKQTVLAAIVNFSGPAFFAFLEDPDTENEHIHCQLRKGTTYPPISIQGEPTEP
jgi:hypothetical protein